MPRERTQDARETTDGEGPVTLAAKKALDMLREAVREGEGGNIHRALELASIAYEDYYGPVVG